MMPFEAAQAADAGADFLGAARSGLVAELGVAQVGAAHHADVGGSVLDELLGDPGLVDAAHGGTGMVTCFLISRERSAWLACLVPAGGWRSRA